MAAASLSFFRFDLGNFTVSKQRDALITTCSPDVSENVKSFFQAEQTTFAKYLLALGSKKMTFQANLIQFKAAPIANISNAMYRIIQAKEKKQVLDTLVANGDAESKLRQSADQATRQYEEANRSYRDVCAEAKIQILFE